MKQNTNRSSFFNQFHFYDEAEQSLLNKLCQHLQSGQGLATVFTPNPEQLVQAKHQPQFAQALHQADYLLPDGIGLVWASRFLAASKFPQVRQRITGVEVAKKLLNFAQDQQLKALIVGGQDYQDFVTNFRQVDDSQPNLPSTYQFKFNQLKSNLFWTPGYKDVKNPKLDEEKKLIKAIELLKPDVVFVAFGAPQQEAWVVEHRQILSKNEVKLAMVVGGAFDFILGKIKRAPGWMQQLGLEWLYRLIKQPWRLRRQLRLVEFSWMVLTKSPINLLIMFLIGVVSFGLVNSFGVGEFDLYHRQEVIKDLTVNEKDKSPYDKSAPITSPPNSVQPSDLGYLSDFEFCLRQKTKPIETDRDDYQLQLKSGAFTPAKNKIDNCLQYCQGEDTYYVYLQLGKDSISESIKKRLSSWGLYLDSYIPNNTWIAQIACDKQRGMMPQMIRWIGPIEFETKVAPQILKGNIGDWAKEEGQVLISILFHEDVSQSEVEELLPKFEAKILNKFKVSNRYYLKLPEAQIKLLAQQNEVKYIGEYPPPPIVH